MAYNLVSEEAFTTEESSEMRFKERQVGQDNFVSESIQIEKGVVHVVEATEDFGLSDPAGASRVDHTQYLKIVTVPNEISDKSEVNIVSDKAIVKTSKDTENTKGTGIELDLRGGYVEVTMKMKVFKQLLNEEVDHSRGHEIRVGEREITKVQSIVVKTRGNVERTEDRVALK